MKIAQIINEILAYSRRNIPVKYFKIISYTLWISAIVAVTQRFLLFCATTASKLKLWKFLHLVIKIPSHVLN